MSIHSPFSARVADHRSWRVADTQRAVPATGTTEFYEWASAVGIQLAQVAGPSLLSPATALTVDAIA